jgi:two-component system cell cycle sensor histidine kinase/response regulator CckA
MSKTLLQSLRVATILIVDDEPEVRKLVGAMLTREGHSVVISDSGEHALNAYEKHQGHVDLLLTDVVSPGMSGPVLADRLTEVQSDLRVLFMSGFAGTHVVQRYVVERGFSLLIKPFTMDQLREKVQSVLDQAVPPQAV